MSRKELPQILAGNITELRRKNGMTQARLAEGLGYSDKSVSKWERAEGIPDVICLKKIADRFGVTVDYMLKEEHDEGDFLPEGARKPERESVYTTNRLAVVLVSVLGVWLLAAAVFVIVKLCGFTFPLPFVIALPVTALLLVIFYSLWGKGGRSFFTVSFLVWTVLLLICYLFRRYDPWLLMILGIPATLIVFLSCRVRVKKTETPSDEE